MGQLTQVNRTRVAHACRAHTWLLVSILCVTVAVGHSLRLCFRSSLAIRFVCNVDHGDVKVEDIGADHGCPRGRQYRLRSSIERGERPFNSTAYAGGTVGRPRGDSAGLGHEGLGKVVVR